MPPATDESMSDQDEFGPTIGTAAWWRSWWCGPTFTVTRFNIVGLQLLCTILCAIFWVIHAETEQSWTKPTKYYRHTEATFPLFIDYVTVAPIWTLWLLLDVYRQGTVVSRVWFELLWVLGIATFSIVLAPRIIADNNVYADGNFHGSFFAVEITTLLLSVALCLGYVVSIISICIEHHLRLGHPEVWYSGVRDFPWFGHPPPAGRIGADKSASYGPILIHICGQSRGLGIVYGFYRPLTQFLFKHSVFRRIVGVEPVWLALARGIVGLAFLAGLLAYLAIQCVKLPFQELESVLPVRAREMSFFNRAPSFTLEDLTVAWTLYSFPGGASPLVYPFNATARVYYANGLFHDCVQGPYISQKGPAEPGLDDWTSRMWTFNCSRSGDNIPNPWTSTEQAYGLHAWLDTLRSYITLTMDWSALAESQGIDFISEGWVALAGIDTVFDCVWCAKFYPSLLQFQHPSYIRLPMGQHVKAQVEEYSIYRRRLNFLDVFGISVDLELYTYHPLTSIQPLENTYTRNGTTSSITFYPAYGLATQHLLEEYREYTVIAGLGSSGGLYALLDLIFMILFGRPLMHLIFGTKAISPFGFFTKVFGAKDIRRKLKRRYPNLNSRDPVQRSFSTSDFLHDFVLDFPAGIVRPGIFAQAPHEYTQVEVEEETQELNSWSGQSPSEEIVSSPVRARTEDYAHAKEFDPGDLEKGKAHSI